MHRIILHIRLWNEWRKHCLNSRWYKFLVLIGLVKSPTLIGYYAWFGLKTGLECDEQEEEQMSSSCDAIGCNCKYHDEEEGCLFYFNGSGEEDKPCRNIDEEESEDNDEGRN